MKGVVLELQEELISKNCDILTALRKAHVIATKLKLVEFDKWILHELDGYDNENDAPEYRSVRGVLKAFNPYHGWIPIAISNNELETQICVRNIREPISSLIELYNKCGTDGIHITFPGELLKILNRMVDAGFDMQFALFVGPNCLKEILERVQDCLLHWTLQLEEVGIVGEKLSFTSQEKEKAQTIPQNVYKYYGATTVINAPTTSTQIVTGDDNSIAFNYSSGTTAITEIRESLDKEELSQENKYEANELLSEIDSKIKKKKRPGVIKAAFAGLRDFLINVGAGVTVALIESKINGLF